MPLLILKLKCFKIIMKTAAEFTSKKALFYANIGTHFAIVSLLHRG